MCGVPHQCRNCGVPVFEWVPLSLGHFLISILQVLFLKGQNIQLNHACGGQEAETRGWEEGQV